MQRKLPIGLQNLREIRTQGYVYVDKTAHVAQLTEAGKYYFLARPRRFGKSLLVDTLAEAFASNRELFTGLYLEQHWDWSRKYPVLRFDFSPGVLRTREELDQRITAQLDESARRWSLTLERLDIPSRFEELVLRLTATTQQPVVILIDEYDKPILDNLDHPEQARTMREGLHNFYSVIKSLDPHLKFVLLTGVSKFSKVSLFSGLNNLEDITLDRRTATLCGYTHQEFTTTFAEYLDGVDLAQVRHWYNGYNFLGEPVYNPFDILLYLNQREFKPHWFETGTPTFLIELLRQRQFVIPEADDYWASEDLLGAFEVEAIEPEALLFQTGYATVRERQVRPNGFRYRLGFPNHEVRISLPRAILRRYVPNRREQQRAEDRVFQALEQDDPEALRPALQAFFASIPHDSSQRSGQLRRLLGITGVLPVCGVGRGNSRRGVQLSRTGGFGHRVSRANLAAGIQSGRRRRRSTRVGANQGSWLSPLLRRSTGDLDGHGFQPRAAQSGRLRLGTSVKPITSAPHHIARGCTAPQPGT